MAIQPGEWEYLYQTSTALQLPWELGGPDVCLERLLEEKRLPQALTVLDLGCGLGSAAVYLAALGHTVTGIDLSATAIAKAQKKATAVGVPVTFLVADALASKLKSKQFDLIYDRGCFQHLAPARWPEYRKEVLRLLKPNGRFALEVAQDLVSLDDLKTLFGRAFDLKQVTSVTHVERSTGIPRYHTFAYLARR